MANEKQYVSIINDGTQDLYIKDAEAATKDELNAVVVGSQAVEMFTFEVDTTTMELKCYTTAAYADAFFVEEGLLKLDLSAMPTS